MYDNELPAGDSFDQLLQEYKPMISRGDSFDLPPRVELYLLTPTNSQG